MRQFKTQTDQIYFANYVSLLRTIQSAGGEGFALLEEHEDLLDTLARNYIRIEAKHHPDQCAVKGFKENDKTHSI